MRSGIVAKKLGMTHIYKEGAHIPVSVLSLEKCAVTDIRTREKDGYTAVQVGAGLRKSNRTTKGLKGHFSKNNIAPRQHLMEFKVSDDALTDVGVEFAVTHFQEGQFVDVTGTSKGKGFAGAMKRHNFGGGRASHGTSISHRAHGSTGNCQEPGKVWKGKKMAGHMGDRRVTTQNLQVVLLDEERDLVFIKGAVPGADNSYVSVRDAVKKVASNNAPYEASFKNSANAAPDASVVSDDTASNDGASAPSAEAVEE